jgi:hypothetical protein
MLPFLSRRKQQSNHIDHDNLCKETYIHRSKHCSGSREVGTWQWSGVTCLPNRDARTTSAPVTISVCLVYSIEITACRVCLETL